jgi:hypothetical protein
VPRRQTLAEHQATYENQLEKPDNQKQGLFQKYDSLSFKEKTKVFRNTSWAQKQALFAMLEGADKNTYAEVEDKCNEMRSALRI